VDVSLAPTASAARRATCGARFWLETVDADAHKLPDRVERQHDRVPTIRADRRKPYTSVRFLPDYVGLAA
jgi:hypothetical protein